VLAFVSISKSFHIKVTSLHQLVLFSQDPDSPLEQRHPHPALADPDNSRRDGSLQIDRTLHALRHTHVSRVIAAGMGVLTISRRIGHASAAITLHVYVHLFTIPTRTLPKSWKPRLLRCEPNENGLPEMPVAIRWQFAHVVLLSR
jgi:integrase